MCGIVGIAHPAGGPPVEAEDIARMCDAIRHRGPDDAGIHVDGATGIGMRRLSIIDLGGGHQPIFNEDGTKAIVFNGEIYNYRELRSGLLERGHVLRTNSDTEAIVHLYEEHGADCAKLLRGMFAFAIRDTTRGTLTLARDRFGIKPLYIAESRGSVAFASELKALVAGGHVDGSLDRAAIEAFFRLGYIPAPYTPFRGVRKLEPGHVLVWREDGSCTDREYWDVPVGERETPTRIAEEVLSWIDESVAAHLVSDVPLAALLSGGLDSSAVVSSMAQTGVTPHAFTARYRGSGAEAADESGLAALLTQRYGAKLTVVDIEPNITELIEPIVTALDEPHADESAVPTWLISQRVAQEYKVVLAGTGGDELFAGYRRHFGLLLSDRYTKLPNALRSALAAAISRIPEPRSGSLSVHRLKRFVRTARGDVPARYFNLLDKLPAEGDSLFADGFRERGRPSVAAERLDALYRLGGAPSGIQAALYLDYKTYLPDDILHVSDRISMAHSLEMRVPFVDHVLVERAFPIPDRIRVDGGKPKHLLRRALQPRLPKQHFTAPKRGFVGPTAMWLRNELRPMLLDELSPDRMRRLGYFDPAVVAGLIDDHMSLRHNREAVLWALLSFSVWHRVYCEGALGRAQPRSLSLSSSR